jgi:hypothetical protein
VCAMPFNHSYQTLTMPSAVTVMLTFFVWAALEAPTTLAQPTPSTLPSVPLYHFSDNGMLADGVWITVQIGVPPQGVPPINVSVLLGKIIRGSNSCQSNSCHCHRPLLSESVSHREGLCSVTCSCTFTKGHICLT